MSPRAASAASARFVASVVVPAHNEATRGFHVLEPLRAIADRCLVVVVCNGCTDDTAERARAVDGLVVLDTPVPNKANALNLGDARAGDVFPRLYLDADVEVSAASLLALAEGLDVPTALAAGPRVTYERGVGTPLARAYFASFDMLPFLRELRARHLDGRGLYGTNRAGRARFAAFPEQWADDTFFDLLFAPAEKRTVDAATVTLRAPDTLAGFLRARTRAAQGALHLARWRREQPGWAAGQPEGAPGLLRRVAAYRRDAGLVPSLAPSSLGLLGTYLFVESYARGRARVLERLDRRSSWR